MYMKLVYFLNYLAFSILSVPDEGFYLAFSILSVPDEGFSRSVLCALSLISTFLILLTEVCATQS